MTLKELSDFVRELFPREPCTLPRILMAWCVKDSNGTLSELLAAMGTTIERLMLALEPFLMDAVKEDQDLITHCILTVKKGPILGLHLLTALCHAETHRITRTLRQSRIDPTVMAALIESRTAQTDIPPRIASSRTLREDGILRQYGRDLCRCAAEGEFDDLLERREETELIIQVLLRRRKRNVILTGPAGVGKTALVESLSRRIFSGEVPVRLKNTRIYELSMAGLVAGTALRGMFEERVKKIIDALVACRPAILFIDEVHLIFGTGRGEGAPMDVANILKPALADGRISMIGATTASEYRRFIARDTALARRFHEVKLSEPDHIVVREILCNATPHLEEHYGVRICPGVLSAVLDLTERLLPNRCQPDKSVDLLESCAARAEAENRSIVSQADVYSVFARQTGHPVEGLDAGQRGFLRRLPRKLKERIIGQDHAIDSVVSALIRHRYGFCAGGRNLGAFLFAGATGVGKTELARTLAVEYFGARKYLLHLDMGEYSQPDAVHKLIGSPYLSSARTDGLLPEWLHERGSGVILFDEIEKAHSQVQHLLLGLLDEGRVTSCAGEQYDSRQCIIVFTTNCISPQDMDRSLMGFIERSSAPNPRELLSRYFAAEFLGRFDEIILFRRLLFTDYRRILRLRIYDILDTMKGSGITIRCDADTLADRILGEVREPNGGVRGLLRLLEARFIQPVAQLCLASETSGAVTFDLGDIFGPNKGDASARHKRSREKSDSSC